jgi:hypothetical protein
MSGGNMILDRTARMAGFEDTKDIWFAHIPDMERAVKAVETATGGATGGAQGTKITVLGTIRHAVLVDQLGVPDGEVRNFDSRPPSPASAI